MCAPARVRLHMRARARRQRRHQRRILNRRRISSGDWRLMRTMASRNSLTVVWYNMRQALSVIRHPGSA